MYIVQMLRNIVNEQCCKTLCVNVQINCAFYSILIQSETIEIAKRGTDTEGGTDTKGGGVLNRLIR